MADDLDVTISLRFGGVLFWKLTRVGDVFRIRQRSTGRYMELRGRNVVTVREPSEAGFWMTGATNVANGGTTQLRHIGTGGFLDAALGGDFRARTVSDGEPWVWTAAGPGSFALQQANTGRFLDAHVTGTFGVVARDPQNNDTQEWEFEVFGGAHTLQDQFDHRFFLDAHVTADHEVVVRSEQQNGTQYWALIERSDNKYTVQQVDTGRYLGTRADHILAPVHTEAAVEDDHQLWQIESTNAVE